MRRYCEDDGIHTMSYGEPVIVTDLQVRIRPRTPAPVVELADGWSEYTPPAERTAEYVPVERETRREPVLVWWLICAIPLGVALGMIGSAIYGAGAR